MSDPNTVHHAGTHHHEGTVAAAGTVATEAEIAAAHGTEVLTHKHTEIEGIPTPLTRSEEVSFAFRKDKLGDKKPSVSLTIPVLTYTGLVQALKDEKQRELIIDFVNAELIGLARQQVDDTEKPVTSQEQLDISKISLEYLANLPPAQRRGGGIPKETWELFAEDYTKVMSAITSKTPEQIGLATKLLVAKFQPVKTQKEVVSKLLDNLHTYAASDIADLEQFEKCYLFLENKAEELLKANLQENVLANLGE